MEYGMYGLLKKLDVQAKKARYVLPHEFSFYIVSVTFL